MAPSITTEKRFAALGRIGAKVFGGEARKLTPAEARKAAHLVRQGMKANRANDLVWRANRGHRDAEGQLMRWAMNQKGPDEEALVNMWNRGHKPGLRLGRGRSAEFHADVKRQVSEIRGRIRTKGDLL